MKLAILTTYWKSPRGGGINSYVTGLVSKLNDISNNIEIKIIFSDGYDNDNYKIHRGRIAWILGSISVLRKIKPDVIHVHESWPLLLGGAIYRTLHRNVRLVYTFLTEPEKPVRLVKKINKRLKKYPYQWALNQCNYVTFASADLRRKIKIVSGFKIKTKTAITYGGVAKKEISSEEIMQFKKRFGLNKGDIILLAQAMTATRPKVEGTKILISAIKSLNHKYSTIKLLITREGRYRRELEDYTNNIGLDNTIIFTGDLDNPFVAVEVADTLCHITLSEGGVSFSVLEAMIMGKPIVASRVGGIPEAIIDGKNGILVDTDQKNIMMAIIKLIENNNFATVLGNTAKKCAEDKFNWDTITKQFLNIYYVLDINNERI